MRPDPQETLAPDLARAVLALAEADTDRQPALSEQTRLVLRRAVGGSPTQGVRHLLTYDDRSPETPVGYAQLVQDEEGGAAEVLVRPEHRRRGHGTALLESLLDAAPRVRVWAHGDGVAARSLAGRLGLVTVRDLWQMSRPLSGDGAELPDARLPEGFSARSFAVGTDEQAWLAVNAAAFASHPEQGRVTRQDLEERIAESWFDASGFILVDDLRGEPAEGTAAFPLAAFHWTKVVPGEDRGEVYVVGVDPAYQGHGLGRAVTVLGLEHLRDGGLSEATLYVDGDNVAAVATYRRLGFQRTTVDVMYSRADPPAVGA